MQIDWHSYIKEAPYEAFRNSSEHRRFLDLCQKLQSLCSIYHGDLRYKNVPKQIISEKTNDFAMRKGHPPYCFRFQCLVTGRKSKFIKECEYISYGISKSDTLTGGDYLQLARTVEDRIGNSREIIASTMAKIVEKCMPSSGTLWWRRYSEYLQSEEWSDKRRQVIERENGACYATHVIGEPLEVHHLTYRNVGRENLDELVALCKQAHQAIHDDSHRMHQVVRSALAPLKERLSHGR